MKTIRSLMTMVGISMVVLVLGTTGAWAQQAPSLSETSFAGTFTLPIDAQWGSMTLPAGEYSLYYGRAGAGDFRLVEVVGKAEGSPHGVIFAQQPEPASATKNSRRGSSGRSFSSSLPPAVSRARSSAFQVLT